MSDERTLRLAYRPIEAALLERYLRFVQLELEGRPSAQALAEAAIEAEDAARISSAVHAFCRPRMLRLRLAGAVAATSEAKQRQDDELAGPIDDADFIALHGEQTHQLLLGHERALVELRARAQAHWRS